MSKGKILLFVIGLLATGYGIRYLFMNHELLDIIVGAFIILSIIVFIVLLIAGMKK